MTRYRYHENDHASWAESLDAWDRSYFVFGSNQAGVHGGGAAHYALRELGARWGVGEGVTGRTYALPTKDWDVVTRPLEAIEDSVALFLDHARANPGADFFVSRVGCGLAGLRDDQVAPMFRGAPDNCVMPPEWAVWLEGP